jgi:SAM-dependent methyltransferase
MDIEENLKTWNEYDWTTGEGGEEWSASWGGTESLWWGTLMPRIHEFIPTGTILELGPGFGRWTHYLRDSCDRLVAVDMSERCIAACRERFEDDPKVELHLNDGISLDMVEDGSVDFVFSFDSLVHAEADVVATYLEQIARKLNPNGVGFIHHSNMAHYRGRAAFTRRVPGRLRAHLVARGILVNTYGYRAETVTAENFEQMCGEQGLACIGQEVINWEHGRHLIDCLSLFTPIDSRWSRPNQRITNPQFKQEAVRLSRIAPLYSPSS